MIDVSLIHCALKLSHKMSPAITIAIKKLNSLKGTNGKKINRWKEFQKTLFEEP